jgi:hypothetical protein
VRGDQASSKGGSNAVREGAQQSFLVRLSLPRKPSPFSAVMPRITLESQLVQDLPAEVQDCRKENALTIDEGIILSDMITRFFKGAMYVFRQFSKRCA